MMTFADTKGKFPTAQQAKTTREKGLQAQQAEEANKHGVTIEEAIRTTIVSVGEQVVVQLEIQSTDASVVLQTIVLTGQHAKQYKLSLSNPFPTPVDEPVMIRLTVKPTYLGAFRVAAHCNFTSNVGGFGISRFVKVIVLQARTWIRPCSQLCHTSAASQKPSSGRLGRLLIHLKPTSLV
jgi:hypothetical protein